MKVTLSLMIVVASIAGFDARALAQAPGEPAQTIRVTGQATVEAAPDQADIDVGRGDAGRDLAARVGR